MVSGCVILAEDDVNQALQEKVASSSEIREAQIALEDDLMTVSVVVDRSVLEELPVNVPFLPRGESLSGEAELQLSVESSRLAVDVDAV